MVRNAFVTEETTTVGSNQHIVLDADTAKVLIGVDNVKIEEVLIDTFLAPEVDEVGDEVDTGFVGHHKTFFQATSEAQTCGTKLTAGASFSIVTYVDLSKTFHIVHVHTHHVTQAVGQEESVSTCLNSIFCIALHQTKRLQAFCHQAAHIHVDIIVTYTGTTVRECQVVAIYHNIINILLALRKLTRNGRRTRMVRTIMVHRFSTSIYEQ